MGLLQRGAWERAVVLNKQTNNKQKAPHITVLHVQKMYWVKEVIFS